MPAIKYSSNETINWSNGQIVVVDMQLNAESDVVFSMINHEAGAKYLIKIINHGTYKFKLADGSILWPSKFNPVGINYTLSYDIAGAVDMIELIYDGSQYIVIYWDINYGVGV